MIILELKELSPNHNYQRTIVAMLSIPLDPKMGFRGDEIIRTVPLRKKVEAATDRIALTKDEYQEIRTRLLNGYYQDNEPLTHQMIEDICYAPTNDACATTA